MKDQVSRLGWLWKYHESYAMTREGNWRLRGCRRYFAIKCRKLTSGFVSGSITVLDGRTLVKCTPVPCLPYFAIEKLGGRDREQFVDRSRNFRINSRTKQSTATSFKRILKMENFLSSLKNPYFPWSIYIYINKIKLQID